ncbi:MAG TPA: MATE family efflux transporter [Bacilli bacterium]|nr:MATE family efflux transporter [Bacilli bacterium]
MTRKNTLFDKQFLTKLLIVAGPVIIQQLLLRTFGIVDTIMVRSIERGISGVGLANQLSNIGFTVMFGVTVGVGIYMAQYYGERDYENIKKSFSLLMFIGLIFGIVFSLIGIIFPTQFLSLFSKDTEVISVARKYLIITSIGFTPNVLAFCYSTVYRNIQKTYIPLIFSITSSLINVVLNYFLIFGHWIFPELGIKGAAIATTVSSFIGYFLNVFYSRVTKQPFTPKLSHIKESFNKIFVSKILKRTYPLVINETFFSIGSALYVVFFNALGTDSYEGYQIAESVVSVMFVVGMALGTAVSAMLGEKLGLNEEEEAKRYGRNFIIIGLIVAILLGGSTSVFAKPLVSLFRSDKTEAAANIAVTLMYVFGLRVALRTFVVLLYSVFRAGGMSRFVMLLDAGVMWLVGLPLAFVCYRFLKIRDIAIFYLILQLELVVRIIIGFIEYYRYRWIANVIKEI